MKIAYIADARSPIAQNWIGYFVDRGYDVSIISSYPCSPDAIPGARVFQVPIAFSQFSRVGRDGTMGRAKKPNALFPLLSHLRVGASSELLRNAHRWFAAVDLRRHVQTTRQLIEEIGPNLVHAMRIPFEGILAAQATPAQIPLLISVWGNDFTLHASQNPLVARQTRSALKRTSALHCDCHRDLHLARCWGFGEGKAASVLPGAGGIHVGTFFPGTADVTLREQLQIADDAPVIINPRGFRNYVCNDAFFQSIPLVLRKHPNAIFLSSAMQGNPVTEKWLRQLGIEQSVRLLPLVPRERMAALFRLAVVTVSPSLHDGTPNTLLEAMACECFPIAGNIESVREWIDHGANGLLCDPTDPEALADNITRALEDRELRENARERNLALIAERAEYTRVMSQAEQFYLEIVRHRLIEA